MACAGGLFQRFHQVSSRRGGGSATKTRGPSTIITIMPVQVPGIQTLNFAEEKDVVGKLKSMTKWGPDVGIEAVGCHYTKSLLHKIETAVGLETDSGDTLNEMIKAVRKVRPSSCGRGCALCPCFFPLVHA